jgi:AcrR family transcriptional regulator
MNAEARPKTRRAATAKTHAERGKTHAERGKTHAESAKTHAERGKARVESAKTRAESARKRAKRELVRGEPIVQRVLAATIEELARVGYRALRIEDVAVRAEVNKTTVYRRWPEKCALVRDALGCATNEKPAPPCKGALRADLVALGKALVEMFSQPRGQSLMRMMVAEGADSELAVIKQDLRRERRVIPLAVLREAVARGEIDPDVDLQLFLDTLMGALHHRIFFMNERPTREFVERLVDLLIGGVRPSHGARAPTPPCDAADTQDA